jgi:hypothetical protein
MLKRTSFGVLIVLASFLALTISCSEQTQTPQLSNDLSQSEPSVFSPTDGDHVVRRAMEDEAGPRAISANGAIGQVDPSTLVCNGLITFDDLPAAPPPGLNYDSIFESNSADFAERFVGQTLSTVGDHDVLSGTPSGPLSLQVGAPNQNINVISSPDCGADNVLDGLGPLGYPNLNAVGEGSFAVLFDFDQSQFGFTLCGGDGGTATVNFFRRDGSLIDQIVLVGLSTQDYGFSRAGGIRDIAGISIHNDDPAGVGFDNLCHDVPGIEGRYALDIKPTSCPNPLNPVSKGVVPVAILGTGTGDVMDIDVSTLTLEGVAPIRSGYEDVSTPVVDGEECECNTYAADGFTDLTLKFKTQELVAALGTFATGDVLALTLTGNLLDGTPFAISDCMIVKGKPTNATQ